MGLYSRFVLPGLINCGCSAPPVTWHRRRIVPRAINCPTVEQYAAGVASRFLRRNIGDADADSWHRLTLAFAW